MIFCIARSHKNSNYRVITELTKLENLYFADQMVLTRV
jgi:hypothetical protein